jgi:hypothetical protein
MNLNIFLGKLRDLHIMLRMLSIHTCFLEQVAMQIIQTVSYQISRTHIMLFIKNNLNILKKGVQTTMKIELSSVKSGKWE